VEITKVTKIQIIGSAVLACLIRALPAWADAVTYDYTAVIVNSSGYQGVGDDPWSAGQTISGSFTYYETDCSTGCGGGVTWVDSDQFSNAILGFQGDDTMDAFGNITNGYVGIFGPGAPFANAAGYYFTATGTDPNNAELSASIGINLYTSDTALITTAIDAETLGPLPALPAFDVEATVSFNVYSSAAPDPYDAIEQYGATITSLSEVSVPEPASMAMMAMPLLGLGLVRAAGRRRASVRSVPAGVGDSLLAHVAPLGWEHIVLTGDFVGANNNAASDFRPLRDIPSGFMTPAA